MTSRRGRRNGCFGSISCGSGSTSRTQQRRAWGPKLYLRLTTTRAPRGGRQDKKFGKSSDFGIAGHRAHRFEPSGACTNDHLRQRPTSVSCPSCRMRTSLRSTGIKPIRGYRPGSRPMNLGSPWGESPCSPRPAPELTNEWKRPPALGYSTSLGWQACPWSPRGSHFRA